MQLGVWRPDGLLDGPSARSPQQVLGQRRCIRNDPSQERPRDARSSRMKSAAGRPRSTGVALAICSKTSSASGRETSRSRISWMYEVTVRPLFLARLTSSRCSRSGTLLTWIILGMRGACRMRGTCASDRVLSPRAARLAAGEGGGAAIESRARPPASAGRVRRVARPGLSDGETGTGGLHERTAPPRRRPDPRWSSSSSLSSGEGHAPGPHDFVAMPVSKN